MIFTLNLKVWIWILIVPFPEGESTNVSYNQHRLPVCSAWNATGILGIYSDPFGNQLTDLFVDRNNMIYVTIIGYRFVREYHSSGSDTLRTSFRNLVDPMSLFITIDRTIYADNGHAGTVEKWTVNATNSTTVMKVNSSCLGLFVDIIDNLYCSLGAAHQVVKRSLIAGGNSLETTIAGNGVCGSTLDMLCEPRGIFVTIKLNLYVADCKNNRIQLFLPSQLIGQTIAGGTKISNMKLSCPSDVIVDADDYLFIVDSKNNRIIRSNENGFYCIAGCSTMEGFASDRLSEPSAAALDTFGNILVIDTGNWRTQKFLLVKNTEDITNESENIQSTYFSVLTRNSPRYSPDDCTPATHYYEAIQLTVSNSGCHEFVSTSPISIVMYLYIHHFNISNLNANWFVHYHIRENSTESKFTVRLENAIKYVLMISTYVPGKIGNFPIMVSGTGKVDFSRMNTQSMSIQATYDSCITANSSKYTRDCVQPNYHYEAIEITVVENGTYTFSSYSEINIYGYLYENNFNPFNPSENRINENDDSGCNGQFKLIQYMQKQKIYILVITTVRENDIGSFTITAFGSNDVTMKHSVSVVEIPIEYGPCPNSTTQILTVRFPLYHSFQPNRYSEAIDITVTENGTYTLGSDSEMDTDGYLYVDKLDLFYPLQYEINTNDNDGCNKQFKLTQYLEKNRTYILLVTTHSLNETGSFFIYVLGPNNATLKPSSNVLNPLQTSYTSSLTENSSKYPRTCFRPNFYYEAIEINVAKYDVYNFVADGQMKTVGYLYRDKFDPFRPFDASSYLITKGNDAGFSDQFRLNHFLEKEITYILVVTTFRENDTGSFTITAFSSNPVTMRHSDSPSVPVQTIYTVDLTTDSSTYTREGIRPNYYYEAIEVNVFEDGPYIFSSDSMMNAYGYLYEHNFDPFNPPLNLVSNGATIGCLDMFGLTYYFEKQKKYIWVITTFFPNTIGSLEILILGLNNITMKRIESPSVPIQAMYASNLTTESAHYFRDCIRPNYYFEAIEIDVVEDGSYTIGTSSEKYICAYLHENKFNPFDPLGKQIIESDCDRSQMQIKFIHHLQKHITYILVVTTRSPNETGSFSVIVLGPNNVTLKRNDAPSTSAHPIYASNLTINSPKYSRNCIQPNYYYEVVEVNVVSDGVYTLGSDNSITIYGYLYKNKFNPLNPTENQIDENSLSGCKKQFKLQKRTTYILVITTDWPNTIGSFSIMALGPSNVTIKRSNPSYASCFLSSHCRFYEKTIGLTLDDILRDHIRWNTTFNQQSLIVKVSAAVTIIMFIGGLINGVLSGITFQNKELRNVGCGIYLLASSVTSLLTISIFTVKFWFLALTHMTPTMDVSAVSGGCKSIEPLLKIFLYLDTWLNACVAIERAINVSKGVSFNKAKSRYIARWLLAILPVFVIGSLIHEPIKREAFEFETDANATLDKNGTSTKTRDNYVYCIARYSPALQNYNTIVLFFHLLGPFAINLFSAFYIIFGVARQRAIAQPIRSYKAHVHEQFNEHKHLLISPLVLVILASPRLIIAVLSPCIDVSQNPWLYLSAYFISFIPSMVIFIIFVLPSSLYMNKFKDTIRSWKQRLCG